MNYVIAAWSSLGALLAVYAAWALRRERALRRALSEGREDTA